MVLVSIGCITEKRGEIPPKTFEKLDLYFATPPEFNKSVELTFDVIYVYDRENVTFSVDLPRGFERVSGDLEWEGNYVKNTPVQLKAFVKPVETGEWEIKAFFKFDSRTVLVKILYVDVSEDSVKVSTTPTPGAAAKLKKVE